MTFGAPGYLWFLLLPLAAYLVTLWWLLWRARARSRFGGLRHERGAASFAGPAALLLSIALAVFAAARPQWGSHPQPLDDRGIDVAIVLDVSNSMLADDVKPSRLGRAQAELAALLDRLPGDRVGLIIFAGAPLVRSPLTSDLRALRTLTEGVDRERGLVSPGSDLGGAVQAAHRMLAGGAADAQVMLIVSDGEDRAAGAAEAVAAARAAGIVIYTAGVGTPQGAPVRDTDPQTHEARDRIGQDGAPVITRLDQAALLRIASVGGGRYIALGEDRAQDSGPLTVLAAELDGLARTRFGSASSTQPVERFQLFAVIALLLVAGELALPLLRRNRNSGARTLARFWPVAAAGLLVGGICSTSVGELNRHGNVEYARARYDAAIPLYRTAQARDPSLGELFYNAGNALDQKGDYRDAVAETRRALPGSTALASRIEYALGNHYAGAVQLADAAEAYRRALLADAGDADAKHNLEVITARLSPSPRPPPSRTPQPGDSTPTPASEGTPIGAPTSSSGAGNGTAAAGATAPSQGSSGGEAAQLSQEELQRRLAEALSGIEKQFSEEDALRILDLLAEQNRRANEQFQAGTHPASPPDY